MDERLLSLYIPVQQAIINHWMGEIPLHQTSLLLYINERTLRYGKQAEHINRSHFLVGVKDGKGEVLHNGINLAHTSLWKYVRELEDTNMITVEHHPRSRRGNRYALNLTAIMQPVTKRTRRIRVTNSTDRNRR